MDGPAPLPANSKRVTSLIARQTIFRRMVAPGRHRASGSRTACPACAHAEKPRPPWASSSQPSAVTGRIEIYGDTYGGPVADQWRQTLESVDGTALSTRRVRRLLRTWDHENLLEVLRGPGDMHVVILKNDHGDIYFHAEWPYDLPQAWNERTIIAADHDSAGAVFAPHPHRSRSDEGRPHAA